MKTQAIIPGLLTRVVGIDCHPDISVLQVTEGTNAFDFYTVGGACRMENGRLREWLKAHAQKNDVYVMEASSISFTLMDMMREIGCRALVVDSAGVKKSDKTDNDNDAVAALRIAAHWWSGKARVVWRPDPKTRIYRVLLRAYSNSVTEATRCLNETAGFLTIYGLRPGSENEEESKEKAKAFVESKEARRYCLSRMPSPDEREMLQQHYARYDRALAERVVMTRKICKEVYKNPQMLACMRIPGIGVITAFAIVAVVGDINRFRTPKNLASYLGLTPGSHQSGNGGTQGKPIPGGGRKDVRTLLIEAAHTILRNSRGRSALRAWGVGLGRTKIKNVCAVAVARKLAHYIWALLSGRKPTEQEKKAATCNKMRRLADGLGIDEWRAMGYKTKTSFLRAVVGKVCSIILPERAELSMELLRFKKTALDRRLLPELLSYTPIQKSPLP